ncbi:related to Smr domain-containing protein YPL199C [Saccharomycodes ludwigii]|uniref:Related to Smr domain-containing protein YPL199C n=1 Tax=Saccharomycodes ludwigii TaxID=36035 RepID=A0A376B9D7_9ASCO|nr:hypothetical protein SCDLUD_001096 [Saccharomycodes ludwigii]KAH3903456.1 hypothetical protein SCDLUD_001096 [Saccharomycodes ludwigii]SSD61293.1 related to Smr domain-containing protein YPL199C [Saccharomycodes ludwigii]
MSITTTTKQPFGDYLSNNGKDYNHATDNQYKILRTKADEAFKRKQQLSIESQSAYKSNDKKRAHELSEEAKKYLKTAENYNMQAAEYALIENNTDSASDEIDLHGLYVKEAQWIMQRRIANGVGNNEQVLKAIVGKGKHSANGIARLKPVIEELCETVHLNNYVDPNNSGVLIIDLRNVANRIPSSWATMDYSTFLHHDGASDGVVKPQNGTAYNHDDPKPQYQQPQYQQLQYQQPQYQQQQPQYQQQQPQYQQQPQQQQPQQQQSDNSLGSLLLKVFCICLQKNL